MVHRFNSVTQRMNFALQMLPLQKSKVHGKKLDAVQSLQHDMVQAQYTASAAAEEQSAELKRLMDMSKVDNTKTHDMLQSIMDVLQTNSYCDRQGRCEQVTVASELDDLREELEQARMRKNRAEEEYINQIIQVIQMSESSPNQQPATRGAGERSADTDMPSDLLCPISYQLFEDPVMLVESGHTYERRSIEEWLVRGNRKDPLSGVQLSNFLLVPNVVVKKLVNDWLAQHPDYKRPESPTRYTPRPTTSLQQSRTAAASTLTANSQDNEVSADKYTDQNADLQKQMAQLYLSAHKQQQQEKFAAGQCSSSKSTDAGGSQSWSALLPEAVQMSEQDRAAWKAAQLADSMPPPDPLVFMRVGAATSEYPRSAELDQPLATLMEYPSSRHSETSDRYGSDDHDSCHSMRGAAVAMTAGVPFEDRRRLSSSQKDAVHRPSEYDVHPHDMAGISRSASHAQHASSKHGPAQRLVQSFAQRPASPEWQQPPRPQTRPGQSGAMQHGTPSTRGGLHYAPHQAMPAAGRVGSGSSEGMPPAASRQQHRGTSADGAHSSNSTDDVDDVHNTSDTNLTIDSLRDPFAGIREAGRVMNLKHGSKIERQAEKERLRKELEQQHRQRLRGNPPIEVRDSSGSDAYVERGGVRVVRPDLTAAYPETPVVNPRDSGDAPMCYPYPPLLRGSYSDDLTRSAAGVQDHDAARRVSFARAHSSEAAERDDHRPSHHDDGPNGRYQGDEHQREAIRQQHPSLVNEYPRLVASNEPLRQDQQQYIQKRQQQQQQQRQQQEQPAYYDYNQEPLRNLDSFEQHTRQRAPQGDVPRVPHSEFMPPASHEDQGYDHSLSQSGLRRDAQSFTSQSSHSSSAAGSRQPAPVVNKFTKSLSSDTAAMQQRAPAAANHMRRTSSEGVSGARKGRGASDGMSVSSGDGSTTSSKLGKGLKSMFGKAKYMFTYDEEHC
eukprot:jgi/Chrzof1/9021/Cz03g33080.t1